jgi:hypothetical protein
MDGCRAKWKRQRHGPARDMGENQRIKVQLGIWEVYDRGNSVRGREKWWRDSDVETRREKAGIGRKEMREGAECATRGGRPSGTCEMDVAKWERGRERSEEKYVQNEEEREIRWMKKIWERRERIEKERGGDRNEKCYFWKFWKESESYKAK